MEIIHVRIHHTFLDDVLVNSIEIEVPWTHNVIENLTSFFIPYDVNHSIQLSPEAKKLQLSRYDKIYPPKNIMDTYSTNLDRDCSICLESLQFQYDDLFILKFIRDLNFETDITKCIMDFIFPQVRRLACGHMFHKNCIDDWINSRLDGGDTLEDCSCPNCRQRLVDETREKLETSEPGRWSEILITD